MSDFVYGTAWKERRTEGCVFEALRLGFRAIDTANQRKHYYEEGVGRALTRAYSELKLKRRDIILQTKFTYAPSQDHRLPFDLNAHPRDQVLQSFESSLEHLKTDYLDSFLLHSPQSDDCLTRIDWAVWRSMETLFHQGKVKRIGISNVNLKQLKALHSRAEVKPSVVQNRCFARTKWNQDVRSFCRKKGIQYQGFSLLTANMDFLGDTSSHGKGLAPSLRNVCLRTGKNIQEVVFRFAQQIGITPVTGTKSKKHMKADLDSSSFSLSSEEIEIIENIAFQQSSKKPK